MTKRDLCPSATGQSENAKIIGFIGADGAVASITTPIPLTDEMRSTMGTKPERIFRLASPCVASNCANWQNNECGVIGRMRKEIGSRQIVANSDRKLPECGIRPDCVWWRQTGPDACRICPHVIYNPSP